MIASVHVIDSNPIRNLVRRAPAPKDVPGLRWSRKAFIGQLSSGALPDTQPGRGGFVAWWDGEDSLDTYLQSDRSGPYSEGWSVRLRPTRTRAVWPEADFDPFPDDNERHEGVHAAATLGSAVFPRVPRFFKVTGHLEEQFLADEHGLYGLAIAMLPRIVMTLTFWTDQDSTDRYVRSGAHAAAMTSHYDFPSDTHEFISEGGFFGFEPYGYAGRLTGKNPTPAEFSGA